jgi:integrase
MKLNKETVAGLKLPAGKSDAIFFDEDLAGFGVRLRAGGKRTWIAQYRIGTKQRRLTLGAVAKLDADKARAEAKNRLAQVTLGSDPQQAKHEARARAAETFGSVVGLYLAANRERLRPKSFHEVQRYLEKSWRPMHGLSVHKIDRRSVAARLAEIAVENGRVTATRARAALSALLAWAMRQGLVNENVVIGTDKGSSGTPRDRVLSSAELAAIWAAVPANDYGRIVKLLILTGQRREEIGALRWSEIDLEKRLIELPRERTKGNRPHDVFLSDSALEILHECRRRDGRDLVFGDGAGAFSGWSKAKEALDSAIEAGRGKHAPAPKAWRLHDLRRTCATGLADLSVQPHVVEAVLGHQWQTGVAGTYNRATYNREKAEALTLWADHVRSFVQGAEYKVVALKPRS